MRIAIIGAGAIGGSLAAELSLTGADIVVVARGEHGEIIARDGLRYRTPHSDRHVAMSVAPDIALLARAGIDLAMLCTKLGDTEAAAEAIASVDQALPTLCLQNGVAGEAMAARHLGCVYGGMVYLPATYLEAGCVDNYCSNGPGALRIGHYAGDTCSLFGALAATLAKAGFNARLTDEIMAWKYAKLLTNLGNALELAAVPRDQIEPLYAEAVAEGEACLNAAGVSYFSVEELVRAVSVETDEISGKARPGGSTWQSAARKRTLESPYLNGVIVDLGRAHGIATPVNSMLANVE